MYVETYDEFTKRHAPNGKADYLDNNTDGGVVRLFANGASVFRDSYSRSEQFREPPPAGSVELLRVRRVYLKAKLDREIEDWRTFHNFQVEQASYALQFPGAVPPARTDAVQQLEAGKRRISELVQAIVALDEQLGATTQDTQRQREAELDGAEIQRRKLHFDQLTSMSLSSAASEEAAVKRLEKVMDSAFESAITRLAQDYGIAPGGRQ